jgi:hypothetical protein
MTHDCTYRVLAHQLFCLPALVAQLNAHLLILHDCAFGCHFQLIICRARSANTALTPATQNMYTAVLLQPASILACELHHFNFGILDFGSSFTLPLLSVLDVLAIYVSAERNIERTPYMSGQQPVCMIRQHQKQRQII